MEPGQPRHTRKPGADIMAIGARLGKSEMENVGGHRQIGDARCIAAKLWLRLQPRFQNLGQFGQGAASPLGGVLVAAVAHEHRVQHDIDDHR